MKQAQLIHNAAEWASRAPGVRGCLLIGDFALGAATDESLIQIVVVALDPAKYLQTRDWMKAFCNITGSMPEGDGLIRLFFENGSEMELTFVGESWLSVDPVEPMVASRLSSGAQILADPDGLLARLLDRIDLRHRT